MPWFGRQPSPIGAPAAAVGAIGNMFDPVAVLAALDVVTPDYFDRVDRSELIYPACTRSLTDKAGDVRSIWEQTRIEAMRYVMMVPGRKIELLVDPARRTEMMEAFLQRRPHEDTVVDFTGVAIDDYSVAIIAGLNWLNHCAVLAGAILTKSGGRCAISGRSCRSLSDGGQLMVPVLAAIACLLSGSIRR